MNGTQDIESPISEYYVGRSIFITGGTGFMGKVLLEKLLRSCPGINQIYVLIRPKKGLSPQERLDAMLEGRLFTILSNNNNNVKKVVAVSGDITEPNLGISAADEQTIIGAVSVIFHVAATVKFDDDLADSIKMNVKGTLSIIELARKVNSLSSLVHVSTAYSHCYTSSTIEEKFYPMPSNTYSSYSPDELINICQNAKAQGQDKTKDIIGVFPNTYTFTKAMAERVIEEKASDLPVVIMRPSIVVASWKEPIPGWVDNLNGPTGIIVACGVGLLQTILAKRNLKADLMPVDIAINLMCVLASKVAAQTYATDVPKNISIYNCTSGSVIPFKWKQLEGHYDLLLKHPFENMIRYPYKTPMKENYYHDRICRVLFHWIPAYFIDAIVYIARSKPIHLVKIVRKMTKAIEALEYFSTREWTWKTKNVSLLYNELSCGDQSLYNFSFRHFDDWNGYFESYALGARQFVMKSDPNTIDACRNKLKKFYLANQLLNILFVVISYFLLYWLWKYLL